jgi:CBS domain-containing protein
MQRLYVRDIMSSPVFTVAPHTRLPAIKLLMRQNQVHRLPVVDGPRLVGIITLGDVRNAFPSDIAFVGTFEQTNLLDKVTAQDIMRTDVLTITPDAALVEAATLLVSHKLGGLPVLDGDRLVGIITKSDLCRAIIDGVIALAPQLVTPKTDGQVSKALLD